MDSYDEAIKEEEHLRRLEQQIIDMLTDKSLDYRQIVKELNHGCQYSSPDKLAVVRILHDIRKTGLTDMKKLKRVLNYYAIERDYGMLVLKR